MRRVSSRTASPVDDNCGGEGGWGAPLTDSLRQILHGLYFCDIVDDHGAVHPGDYVPVDLLGPLDWVCWGHVEVFEVEL